MEQDVVVELPPPDLGQELVGLGLGGVAHGRRGVNGPPDLTRADLAEMQVRGESGCSGDARQIALDAIAVDGVSQELVEGLGGPGLARRPVGEAG